MSLDNFAEAITGLAGVGAQVDRLCTREQFENLGKKKEIKHVSCEKSASYNKSDQKELVLAEMKNYPDWILWDDGTSSRQDFKDHRFVICRYV